MLCLTRALEGIDDIWGGHASALAGHISFPFSGMASGVSVMARTGWM